MLINNPTYTIRLIDLVSHDDPFFTIEDLYTKVAEWLQRSKYHYYTDDAREWNKFIERFCNRFYSRNLNFDTYYEFQIKLNDCFDTYRDRVDRYVKLKVKELNPWTTYGDETKETGENHGTDASNNTTTATGETTNKSSGSSTDKNDSTNYNLHSDTPSSTVNIKNMFEGSDYVTDATNDKNTSTSTSNSSNNSTSEKSDKTIAQGNNTSDSNHLIDRIVQGYQGNPLEILDNVDKLTDDVINKYLEWIEESHLFSAIYY